MISSLPNRVSSYLSGCWVWLSTSGDNRADTAPSPRYAKRRLELEQLEGRVALANLLFIGGQGDNMSLAYNWSNLDNMGARLSNDKTAVITGTLNHVLNFNSSSPATATLDKNLTISKLSLDKSYSGTITLNNTLTVKSVSDASLGEMAGGTVTGSGKLSFVSADKVAATFTFAKGTISGKDGVVEVLGGAGLRFKGTDLMSPPTLTDRTLQNKNVLIMDGSALKLTGAAKIVNEKLFTIHSVTGVIKADSAATNASIENKGDFSLAAGVASLQVDVPLKSTGKLLISQDGALTLTRGGNNSGEVNFLTGLAHAKAVPATLTIASAPAGAGADTPTFTWLDGAKLTGKGQIILSGKVGVANQYPTLKIESKDGLVLPDTARLAANWSTITGKLTLAGGTEHRIDGTILKGATVTVQASARLTFGAVGSNSNLMEGTTLTNNGTVDILTSAKLNINNGNSLINTGTLNLRDQSVLSTLDGKGAGFQLNHTGKLTVEKTATFTGIKYKFDGAVKVNDKLIIDGSEWTSKAFGMSLRFDGPFDNTPAKVTALAGATTHGEGKITWPDFENQGTVSPGGALHAGLLTFDGNFAQTAGSMLAEIGGAAGSDKLAVTGTVSLAGGLSLSTLPDLVAPAPGAVYTLIDNQGAAPVAGTFVGLPQGAYIGTGGFGFTISYIGGTGNDVTLTLVSVPPVQQSITGRTWIDANHNGFRDGGEAALPGVTVQILNAGGAVLGDTVTDALGLYTFGNLAPGLYSAVFVRPDGQHFTLFHAGPPPLDSDADPVTGQTMPVALAPGGAFAALDAGLFTNTPPVANADAATTTYDVPVTFNLLANDTDADGDPLTLLSIGEAAHGIVTVGVGGSVTYTADEGFTGVDSFTYTVSDGMGGTAAGTATITVTNPAATASVGDKVWEDTNGNGIQDSGEPGLAGVEVTLVRLADGGTLTAITGPSGLFVFGGLLPGHYSLRFGAPGGYELTDMAQGIDAAADSDADPFSGETAPFTLTVGQNDTTRDAGFVALPLPATVRGRVWADADADGIRDTGEAALAGVLVDLIDAVTGEVLWTVETDANGEYEFAGLWAGAYRVKFRPETGTFSAKDQGGDDTADSDADADGTTDVFALAAGGMKAWLDAGLH